jgi:hypothetical protein
MLPFPCDAMRFAAGLFDCVFLTPYPSAAAPHQFMQRQQEKTTLTKTADDNVVAADAVVRPEGARVHCYDMRNQSGNEWYD